MTSSDLMRLAPMHPGRRIGRRIEVLLETPSTNAAARARAHALGPDDAHGLVVTTLLQTAGRGTRQRRWWSPPGGSLAASVVLAPWPPVTRPAALTLAAALAVVEAGRRLGARLLVRWPNDVVDRAGGKVAGVLAETLSSSRPVHVIGMGMNLALPSEPPPAFVTGEISSLAAAGARETGAAAVLLALLDALEPALDAFERDGAAGLADRFARVSFLTGRRVAMRRGAVRLEGTFLGIGPDLEVHLRRDDGLEESWPGEQLERIHESPPPPG